MRLYVFIIGVFSIFLFPHCAFADDEVDPKKLDGVTIEAVESFINPKNTEFALGAGFYPLDPYFLGFSLNAGFTYYFNNSLAWEILRGSYAFTVQKDLTAQLAKDFGVNPQVIDKLEIIASTGLVLVPTYGKSVLFKGFIQYFRSSFFLGPAFVKSSQASGLGIDLGARMDTYVTESFSWRFEIRDTIAVKGGRNYLAFALGSAIYF